MKCDDGWNVDVMMDGKGRDWGDETRWKMKGKVKKKNPIFTNIKVLAN